MKPFLLPAALLLLATSASAANWITAGGTLTVPRLEVLDEEDRTVQLSAVIEAAGRGPALLVPAYTKCQGSCPLTVRALKKAVERLAPQPDLMPFRVVILSFDSSDSASDLKLFRDHEELPASWKIVRAADKVAIRQFLDAYSYSFMQSQGGFEHPSQFFVLSPDLRWKGSLVGIDLTAEDLQGALRRTKWGPLRNIASRPESWLAVGLTGLLGGLGLVVAMARRLKPSPRPPEQQ